MMMEIFLIKHRQWEINNELIAMNDLKDVVLLLSVRIVDSMSIFSASTNTTNEL